MFDYHLKQWQKFVSTAQIRRIGKPLLLCVGLAVAFFIYLLIFWLRSESGNEHVHEDYLVFLPRQEENEPNIVQEIICPRGAELCLKVEDYQISGESELSTKYQRRLMVETVDDVVLSVADLVPNPGEPFSAQNAMRWTILKSRLALPYTKAVIGQMFATGCVQLDATSSSQTLMIGLGGGVIANFLDELEGNHAVVSVELVPAVEYIARKWFGLEKSAKQKVLIQDGVHYINDWSPSVGRFDCIILDACKSSMDEKPHEKYPLLCPHPNFVASEQLVKNLFSMLKPKGILIINTFVIETDSNEEAAAEERQFLLELFRHHFGQCYYASIPHNKILVCILSPSQMEPMTNKFYERRMKELPIWLQKELEVNVKIVEKIWHKNPDT